MDKERKPYPSWICSECGNKYGRKECGVACWHMDKCGVCGEHKEVTEPRDFGHLKEGWDKITQERKNCFREIVLKYCDENNLKQGDVGLLLNLSPASMSIRLRGEKYPSLLNMVKLAKLTPLTLEQFKSCLYKTDNDCIDFVRNLKTEGK